MMWSFGGRRVPGPKPITPRSPRLAKAWFHRLVAPFALPLGMPVGHGRSFGHSVPVSNMSTVKNLAAWLASRPRKRPCTTLVFHATAGGSLGGAISTLKVKGFSYHVLIDKAGVVWKAVPYTRVAFHAGKSRGPDGFGVNDYSMGICFVNRNDGVDPLTPEQIRAARDYTLELKEVFPSLRWGVTHFGVSWGRKSDPRLFDLKAFCAEVGLRPWKLPVATWRLF